MEAHAHINTLKFSEKELICLNNKTDFSDIFGFLFKSIMLIFTHHGIVVSLPNHIPQPHPNGEMLQLLLEFVELQFGPSSDASIVPQHTLVGSSCDSCPWVANSGSFG